MRSFPLSTRYACLKPKPKNRGYIEEMSFYRGKRLPRSARRSRKPLQDNWIKGPGRGRMLKCTYEKCSHDWEYFGRRKWAKCPACHSVIRIAIAKKNFLYFQRIINTNKHEYE
jgi:hypothetical protein